MAGLLMQGWFDKYAALSDTDLNQMDLVTPRSAEIDLNG
jgi:hypothetical protein